MNYEDVVVEDGKCVVQWVLAVPGDVAVCPEGHEIADVVGVIRMNDRRTANSQDFANWRHESLDPEVNPGRPYCHVCGKPLFLTSWGANRPILKRGVRLVPGDPADPQEVGFMSASVARASMNPAPNCVQSSDV